MGIETPHINALSYEDMLLTRMDTGRSCTNTRATFLTGRHPLRAGIDDLTVKLVIEGLHELEVTIAEVKKEKDYHTAHVGKRLQRDMDTGEIRGDE